MRLKDKVAIITAGGSGSGRDGALIFSREGAKVVVADIDAKAGEQTVAMVKDQGGEATFVRIDVGKVEDVKRLIDTTVETYGKIDALWNHAGIPGPGIIEETNEAEYPHLRKAGGGSITFTASVSALRASAWSPSYALAKGGLIPLVMSLAVYLGPDNIRTNCICPGLIDTPMARVFVDRSGSMAQDALEKAVKGFDLKVPLGRNALSTDIANAALFFASDEASFVNGVILPVDGGATVKF